MFVEAGGIHGCSVQKSKTQALIECGYIALERKARRVPLALEDEDEGWNTYSLCSPDLFSRPFSKKLTYSAFCLK